MRKDVKEKCDLFINNAGEMKKSFKWNDGLMNIAASTAITSIGQKVDISRIKECKEILKNYAGAFSGLRSMAEPVVLCEMALSDNPAKYIEDVKSVYTKISKAAFSDSGYMVQAAISVCDAGKVSETDAIVDKFKKLYKKMSKNHPFITSPEDIVFTVLLTMTDKSVETIIEEMEQCYSYLKNEVNLRVGANEIQGLSEVLTLTDGDMKEKCDKVVLLYNTFKNHKVKYGTECNEFACLGTLIDIDENPDVLVNEIIETEAYIKSHKGFGDWCMNKKQRLVFASMIVGEVYNGKNSVSYNSAVNSTVAAVIAQEVSMMICMSASLAATTSAATH